MNKLVAKELSFDTIKNLTLIDQDAMARTFVKGNSALKDAKDGAQESAKVIGKLGCVLEIRLEAGKKAMAIAQNKTLAEFWKDNYGAPLQTHPLSLKNAFGALVLTGRITEMDYDVNSNNCLELAARIVTAVKGDLEHDAVAKAAAQLIERSNKAAKNLREILATVKPAKAMTADEALASIETIAADGHLSLVTTHIPDIIEKMSEQQQKETVQSFMRSMNRFETMFPNQLESWYQEVPTAAEQAAA